MKKIFIVFSVLFISSLIYADVICKSDSLQTIFPCRDESTGYMWSQIAISDMSWEEAVAYCENLTEGGYQDWHLPSADVWKTLAKQDILYFTIKIFMVRNFSKLGDTGLFWSSSTKTLDAKAPLYVSENSAIRIGFLGWSNFVKYFPPLGEQRKQLEKTAFSYSDKSNRYRVRCARNDENWKNDIPNLQEIAEQIETEHPSSKKVVEQTARFEDSENLQWSQPSPGPMYYSYIQDYCKNLCEGGFSDWRLPTPDELKSNKKICSEFKESDVEGWKQADPSYNLCLWSLNEDENKKDWFDGYEFTNIKDCLSQEWHPCSACRGQICSVACVRNPLHKNIDHNKLQWSKKSSFDTKIYTNSLLSYRHYIYVDDLDSCHCYGENRDVPCGFGENDCVFDIVGVQDPLSYCKNLREGGFEDWRLPTMDELKSIKITDVERKIWEERSFLPSSQSTPNEGWEVNPIYGISRFLSYNLFRFNGTETVCVRDKKENDNLVKLDKKTAKPLPDPQNLTWSKEASNPMTWKEAKEYCSNLRENSFSDWRLPNIDELRTLIQNCDKTESGGSCKISENTQCLDEKCWNEDCNGCNKSDILWEKIQKIEKNGKSRYDDEELLKKYEKQNAADFKNANFSKINSRNAFWSSTLDPENVGEAWGVDFVNARVGHAGMQLHMQTWGNRDVTVSDYKLNVICVR